MKQILVFKKDMTMLVLLLKNKTDSTFSFVNLTKGHICPCRFKTEKEAIEDLQSYKDKGKILNFIEI